MAHECPDCGMMCYCGDDIDDLLLSDTDEELNCTHYLKPLCDAYEDWEREDWEEAGE